jgi:hypothetical protein
MSKFVESVVANLSVESVLHYDFSYAVLFVYMGSA